MPTMIFETRGITPACPYEFSLIIPQKWRREIGLDLYQFIGAVLRRRVPVNKTTNVWIHYTERVIWDDPDTNDWHTEKVYDSLTFTSCATHPGFHAEKIGALRFNTNAWTSGPNYGMEGSHGL